MYFLGSEDEVVEFGFTLLKERLWSLENDVKRCLHEILADMPEHIQPAPFPALLYCFSTVELLGALLAGNASDHAPTSPQTKEYMRRFMGYTQQQAEILVHLYRHKLAHLAQPAPFIEMDGKDISWHIYHSNRVQHLTLEKLAKSQEVALTASVSIHFDYVFHLGITEFMSDIRESVYKSDGYSDSLNKSHDLQRNLDSAIADVYSLKH